MGPSIKYQLLLFETEKKIQQKTICCCHMIYQWTGMTFPKSCNIPLAQLKPYNLSFLFPFLILQNNCLHYSILGT